MKRVLVVGAGFSGAVLARELVEKINCEVVIFEERNHIAGNCHTERDHQTGIMEHVYGPHIFNTSNEFVWKYVNRFGKFRPFVNRVKAHTEKGVFSLPVNLLTINQFFNKSFNPDQARKFVDSLGRKDIEQPRNFEEQALKFLGNDLYENFFKGYTLKQWGTDPVNLPAEILKRLPVRFNYDDNYYATTFQGIPVEGYTNVVCNILDHPKISVQLNTKFEKGGQVGFDHLFFSGPLDAYYNYAKGRLGYRTIYFDKNISNKPDFQGNAVINYCNQSVPFTRIHEHKHFAPWEQHEETLYLVEYSKETLGNDIPFYPKRLTADMELLNQYRMDALNEEAVSFIGRLGTYRYMDMHHVIEEAIHFSNVVVNAVATGKPIPVFPNKERHENHLV
jgi:UDP-galactopyranose mutase